MYSLEVLRNQQIKFNYAVSNKEFYFAALLQGLAELLKRLLLLENGELRHFYPPIHSKHGYYYTVLKYLLARGPERFNKSSLIMLFLDLLPPLWVKHTYLNPFIAHGSLPDVRLIYSSRPYDTYTVRTARSVPSTGVSRAQTRVPIVLPL